MAGDNINVFGKSYYFQNTSGTGGNSTVPIIDLLTAFLNTPAAIGSAHGIAPAVLNIPSGITGIQSLVTQQDNQTNATPNKPRAFINVVLFDEEFKSYDFRISMVGSAGQVKDHFADLQNIAASKSGYVYIYCNNESPVDVFFDNLQLVHTRGPILEENHYYSYGLKIAAISSKAAGALQNSYLYQGDFSEYDEDAGYNEFFLRHYDAQIGRWITADPYQQFASPYLGMGNNPGGMVDPDGGFQIPILADLGSDFLNAAGNSVIGAGVGYGIGRLIGGKEGGKWGAALGFGMVAGSYVPWDDVGNWIGGLFQPKWLPFYKSDLIKYVKERGIIPTENNLGEEFEKIFKEFAENFFAKKDLERSRFRQADRVWKDSKTRNSKPDFVSDDFYNVGGLFFIEEKRVSEGSAFEVKQNNGRGVYLSSNNNQIKGHILNLSAKHAKDIATGKYHPSLTLITTYEVNFSFKTLGFATLHRVQYTQSRSKYKISHGKYKFKFVNYSDSDW